MSPFTRDRLDEIESWDKVKLLTVAVDRLRRWYRPGLLCIGDAAHAMSPIGGVGINLAVQDAVAAANILARAFAPRNRNDRNAQARAAASRISHALHSTPANRPAKQHHRPGARRQAAKAPFFMKMLQWPLLRRIPGRVLALGIRPEHIRTPDICASARNSAA